MDTISTTELVRNIGKYAHLVCYSQRSFLVTANGRPMFKIEPPSAHDALSQINQGSKGEPA